MKYRDEEDKCYGLAGMAIGIAIWKGEDMLYKLDVDDEANECVQFTSDYYYPGNPALPPKETWHFVLKHYQMTVGMLISNMMSRALRKGDCSYEKVRKTLFKSVAEEGRRVCQLDDDEVRTLFNDTYRYLEQVFREPSVRSIAEELAGHLHEKRALSNYEVKELLGVLRQG